MVRPCDPVAPAAGTSALVLAALVAWVLVGTQARRPAWSPTSWDSLLR